LATALRPNSVHTNVLRMHTYCDAQQQTVTARSEKYVNRP